MKHEEMLDHAPFCSFPNGLDPKINYPQSFVYPKADTMVKEPMAPHREMGSKKG
jgi:hypothetical protein